MENYRSRKHCLLLYPEDETHMKALSIIKSSFDYACILHDKDCDDNGELKKAHYHVVVSFPTAKWRTALSKDLGITENYIEQCRSMEHALMYLIHYDDDSKYQYSIDEVHGTLTSKLYKILQNDGKDENDKVVELVSYIRSTSGHISVSDFSYWCSSVGKWDVFRRSASIILRIIDEHNNEVSY